MRAGKRIAVWLVAWALASGAAVAAPPMQIKYAEAVTLPAAAGKAQFDAYGRRFALTLENNDRLLKALPVARKAELGQTKVLRGKVDGAAGSWVRLTRVGNGMEGAIWDGTELYVVTRYASITDKLTTPLSSMTPDQTVVYRLSDTVGGLPAAFCGLTTNTLPQSKAGASALLQYKNVVDELRVNAAGAISDQIDISLIADTAFQNQMGASASDMMLARLNVVDGIFAEQVGVLIVPTEFRLIASNADPFNSTDPETLLSQVATYREATPAVRSAGLAHLMTGKNLDGDTIGIAYLDSLCDAQQGVSLGDSEEGEFLSALVMAHEIGHNFGARHDGVAGICATTSQDYLMAPVINGSTQFSQCSLASIATSVAGARGICIGASNYADVGLVLPPSPYSVQTDGTFSLPVTVRSYGNLPATHVSLKVTFPAYFGMSGATIAGVTCTLANNLVTCPLGDFAAGEERALDLRVSGQTLNSLPVEFLLSADNDRILRNNAGSLQVGLQSGVDLGVTLTASASSFYVTDAVDFTVDVTAHGSLASHGGLVSINIGGVPIESFNAGPHTCAIDQYSNYMLLCQLADVAAHSSTRITVRGRANEARTGGAGVYLNVPNDYDGTNNTANWPFVVLAEREVRTTVSSEDLRAVIGTTYELTYTLTTAGRLPATNVRFSLQQPLFGVIESVVGASTPCVTSPDFTDCDFGTLNPGDVRRVVVRFHMTSTFPSFMSASTRWGGWTGNEYSSVFTHVYANVAIDVAAIAGNSFGVDEGVTSEVGFGVETRGINPAQNVTATFDVALPLQLVSVRFSDGPTGWTCAVLTPQRARCSGSFPGGNFYNLNHAVAWVTFVSDTAGQGQATVTVTTTGDGDPTNDVATAPLTIRPYIDVSITAPNDSRLLMQGDTTTVDATINTGKNPVTDVRVVPWAASSALALDSFSVGGVDCSQTQSGAACDLGNLPAHAAIPVHAVFRALSSEDSTYAVIDVYTQTDSNGNNNHLAIPIYTLGPSDIQISTAQTSVTAVKGTLLTFPRITLMTGAGTGRDITVDIPLPAFASVSSVSSDGMCTGTTSLQCTFLNVPPDNPRYIDIILNADAAGTFTSNLLLHAFNDSTPDNNAASVVLTVSAPASGGGSSSGGAASGGGGGGGRIEWFMLALLGGLVLRRALLAHPTVSSEASSARAA
jgi:hypothetical protein